MWRVCTSVCGEHARHCVLIAPKAVRVACPEAEHAAEQSGCVLASMFVPHMFEVSTNLKHMWGEHMLASMFV